MNFLKKYVGQQWYHNLWQVVSQLATLERFHKMKTTYYFQRESSVCLVYISLSSRNNAVHYINKIYYKYKY